MRSPAILHLLALLVVVGIRCSFGGGEQCFEEGQWGLKYFIQPLGFRGFAMRGQNGTCLVVHVSHIAGGLSFSDAANACALHYENGTLLSNKGFEAYNLNLPKNMPEINTAPYIDISPAPLSGCWVIDSQLILGVEVNCSRPRSFVCEYPRQSVCGWEMMTDLMLVYGGWHLVTWPLYVHNVDDSKTDCRPNLFNAYLPISGALANCSVANGSLMFKDEWSQWSQCGKCSDQNLPSNQSRHQEVIDQCKQFADGVKRNNTKSCPPLMCSSTVKAEDDDEYTSETKKAMTSNGVSLAVISPSRLLIFFFFLSMF